MTAEIAILNTYGVALAADSAVTLSVGVNEKKIYNSANKVFTLSKYFPVGIMIYSNAQFMDIEWEIIIKEYRKKLCKQSFPTLIEYANNFFEYLNKLPFITKLQKEDFFTKTLLNIASKIRTDFLKAINETIKQNGKIVDDEILKIMDSVLDSIIQKQNTVADSTLFKLDINDVKQHLNIFEKVIPFVFENIIINEDQKLKMIEIFTQAVQKTTILQDYSGIVVSGYGEKEIFPSLYSCNVYGLVGNSLVRAKEDINIISSGNRAVICPFAQSEMVSSFMEGIDPSFEKTLTTHIGIMFNGIDSILKEEFKSKTPELLKTLQKFLSEFKRKVYIDPVISIVGSLQKGDLAEMAEALVNLTSFKRHVSTEAETVGGPTDVAIITKGDGFIWIKRKHYFNPDLNRHFFENYFREGDENE